MKTKLSLTTLFFCLLAQTSAANIQYWSSSDSCGGSPTGILLVQERTCIAFGGSTRVWSIRHANTDTCIDVSDFSCTTISEYLAGSSPSQIENPKNSH